MAPLLPSVVPVLPIVSVPDGADDAVSAACAALVVGYHERGRRLLRVLCEDCERSGRRRTGTLAAVFESSIGRIVAIELVAVPAAPTSSGRGLAGWRRRGDDDAPKFVL